MDVLEAIHSRRSIRKYRAQNVDRGLMEELLYAAVQAPTPPASGTTPWALCVVEGIERVAAYGARAKQYAHDHQPAGRPWTWTERPDFKVFWDAPALVLFCAQTGKPETPYDCCRAAQNFMLAAHARSLGTCWVGAPLPWLHSPGVAEEIGIPEGFEAVAAIVVGHPAEKPPGSPRPKPKVVWCEAK
ncbi:MAG TPA: nitroreductase family protein [Nitrospira sp.]|nr:nitroreductase family protein [Nitrospira sp.]